MTARFRKADRRDVVDIEAWLRAERDATGDGFHCNWGVIKGAFREGGLFVVEADGEPVAFLANGRHSHDIAEVRPSRRGRGYGRLIAEAMVRQSRRWGLNVVEIDCAPHTSVPFWARMGFSIHPSRRGFGGGIYAHREIGRRQRLGSGERLGYVIRYYEEKALYATDVPAFRTSAGEAERTDDGRLRLPERAICFDPDIEGGLYDCVVEIELDGRSLFKDKVKRPDAIALGVEFDANGGPFVEVLRPSSL